MRIFITILLVGLLAACTSLKGQPKRGLLTDRAYKAVEALVATNPEATYLDPTKSDAERTTIRTNVATVYMAYYDEKYFDLEGRIRSQGIGSNLALDVIQLGVGAAGTIFTGGASQGLSAATTGLKGSQTAFNQRLFEAQTVNALITQMRADRTSVRVAINEGLKTDKPEDYPIGKVLADLERYRAAGSLASAISSISANAGEQEKKEEKKEEKSFSTNEPVPSNILFDDDIDFYTP